jgi:hypothetical protein
VVTTSISVRPRPSTARLPLVKRPVSLPPAGLVCSAVPRRPRTRCLQGSGVDWVVMGFLGNAFVFSSICSVAKNAEWLFKKDFTPCSTCVAVPARCSGLHAGSWPGLLEYARRPEPGLIFNDVYTKCNYAAKSYPFRFQCISTSELALLRRYVIQQKGAADPS